MASTDEQNVAIGATIMGITCAPGDKACIKSQLELLKARHLERKEKLKNFSGPFASVSAFLDRWVQKNFRSEGGNVGGWEPFARGGRWVKGRGLDTNAKLLQDTGRLRSSFLPFATKNNAGIGSELEYSKNHEEGLNHLPVRRMLPNQAEVKDDVKRILERGVKKAIK